MIKAIKFSLAIFLMVGLCACSHNNEAKQQNAAVQIQQHYVPVHQKTVLTKTIEADVVNVKYEKEKLPAHKAIPVVKSEPEKKNVAKKTMHTVNYQAAIIYFADGSANISSDDATKISKIAKLAKTKGAKISVYGFASSRTRNTDVMSHKLANFNISLQRAENVVANLEKMGVSRSSISMEALSDSQPLYQEVMPEGERLNRRAEIYVSY